MAIQLQPGETRIWYIVQAVIQLVNGRNNASDVVTLSAGATTTVVKNPNCSQDCIPQLSPMTANAAAALATTYISNIAQGQFTITHANNSQTDRTFGYAVLGG